MAEGTPTATPGVALVTGASRGIGRAVAECLARDGHTVVVSDRGPESLGPVTESIERAGGRVLATAADLTDPPAVRHMVREIGRTAGPITTLVNNAALTSMEVITADGDAVSTPEDLWSAVLDVNFLGAVTTTRLVLPAMLEQGGGSIVNIGSVLGLAPKAGAQIAYSCSKAALDMFTRHTAVTFGDRGVRCNMVAPGSILTEVQRAAFTPQQLAEKLANYPSPRLGEPSDVAELVAFLVSGRSGFVNGQVIGVEGAVSRRLVL